MNNEKLPQELIDQLIPENVHIMYCSMYWDELLLKGPSISVEQLDQIWERFMGTYVSDENGNLIIADELSEENKSTANHDLVHRTQALTLTFADLASKVFPLANFNQMLIDLETDSVSFGVELVKKATATKIEKPIATFREKLLNKLNDGK